MKNRLTSFGTVICHETIPALRDTQFPGDLSGGIKEPQENLLIGPLQIAERVRDVAARNDQHVIRSLRLDILKGQHILVLVDRLARNLARSNLTEQTIGNKIILRAQRAPPGKTCTTDEHNRERTR